jgi:Chalcone isomerase-like
LRDVPKRLEIHYFQPIKTGDFARSTEVWIRKNVDEKTYENLRERVARINALYEDVRPGDRYSLTYEVGRGTELALNGTPKGVIDGADFAAAMFSIWIGPHPLNESLRSALLGVP